MEVRRVFVPEGTDPYSLFQYESYDCVMTKKSGEVTFELRNCEVPKHWSKNARDILITKYFRKGGVPDKTYEVPLEHNGPVMPSWLNRREMGEASVLGSEKSVRQVMHRLAGHWTYTGWLNGYFDPTDDQINRSWGRDENWLRNANARAFYDELVFMLLNQMAAPNSPQWFNTGLYWAYGIKGKSDGHHFVDLPANTLRLSPELTLGSIDKARQELSARLKLSPNAYERVQAHACFILNVQDTMCGEGGILDWYEREGRIFKYGSGSGVSLANLRGRNEKLSGGGTSSGAMSWMKVADANAGAIKSGGATRRAATLRSMPLDHPDIKEFIQCKVESEIAVAALVTGSQIVNRWCQKLMDLVAKTAYTSHEMLQQILEPEIEKARAEGVSDNYIDKALWLADFGITKWPGKDYDTDYEGRAYQLVPWQNANNSVRIPNAFYDAVDLDHPWITTYRTTGKDAWSTKARALEREIAEAAWFCGDPGVQYEDNINDWNVTPNDGRITSSNPCSEHMRPDGSACNLASERLMRFLDADGIFDISRFRHVTRLWTMVLDITNTMAHLPDKDTALGVYLWRDIGLGYADLGGVLMSYGLAYDSDQARALAAAITALMHAEAHLTSAELARELGAYPRFWANKEHHLRCTRNHMYAAGLGTGYEGLKVEPPQLDYVALAQVTGCADAWKHNIQHTFDEAYEIAQDHGFRNAEITLVAPTGCLTADSLVVTDRGLQRLGGLGDLDGDQWQDANFMVQTDQGPQRATKFFVNGLASCTQVKTQHDYTLTGTPTHQIKVVTAGGTWEWRRLGEVRPGDTVPLLLGGFVGEPRRVSLPALKPAFHTVHDGRCFVPDSVTPSLARLVGFFMGNGSCHEKGMRWSVDAKDQDVVACLCDDIMTCFGIDATLTSCDGYIEVSINSVPIRKWWKEVGFCKLQVDPAGGKGAYHAYVPDAILCTNSPELYSQFLRGLFQSDGSVEGGVPSMTNVSFEFVQTVRAMLMLLRIPVTSCVHIGGFGGNPVYKLRVINRRIAEQFFVQIGFMGQRKSALRKHTLSQRARYDYIPVPLELLDVVCPDHHPAHKAVLRAGRNGHGIWRELVEQLADESGNAELRHLLNFFYDTVDLVEQVEDHLTYDLSVPENVTYVANGFVSHNTISILMDCDTTGVEPNLGLIVFKQLVGGNEMKLNPAAAVSSALHRLGYSEAEVVRIVNHIRDTNGLLPEQDLKPAHRPIFACSLSNDPINPAIRWQGHIQMMGAVQPFLSGAISKTANMPHNASVEDVKSCYRMGHDLALKAVAIYRDGCKLSQPLTLKTQAKSPVPAVAKEEKKILLSPNQLTNNERVKLGCVRKPGVDVCMGIGGGNLYLRTTHYEDGRVGEIWMNYSADQGTLQAMLSYVCKTANVSLQYGVPLSAIIKCWMDSNFEPNGLTAGHPCIRTARSILNLAAKLLAFHELGDAGVCNTQPVPSAKANGTHVKPVDSPAKQCLECGHQTLLPNGAGCSRCTTCGFASGCG